MNLADAFDQIAVGAAARGGLEDSELDAVLAGTRRGRRRVTGMVAGLAGLAAAGVVALSLLDLGGAPQPPVAPTQTIGPSPAPSSSPAPSGAWPSAVTAASVPACGDPAPAFDSPADPQLVLTVDGIDGLLPADQAVVPTASLASAVGFYGKAGGPITVVAVARDGQWAGKVVAVQDAAMARSPIGSSEATWSLVSPGPVVLSSCIPGLRPRSGEDAIVRQELLPNGSYDLYEFVPLAAVTVDGVAYGGPGTLLLAAGPQTLEIGDPMPAPTAEPDLPGCGQSTQGLSPSGLGPVSAQTIVQRGTMPYFSDALVNDGPAAFSGVRFTRQDWAIAQDGVVVDAGSVGVSGPAFPMSLPAGSGAYADDLTSLERLVDCRTGARLDESVPIEIWTRSVVEIDLTPGLGDDADAEVAFLAPPAWFTYQPAPVPAEVPVVGDGAAAFAGVDSQTVEQVGPRAWSVGQTWADAATWDRIKAAMTAAGYALTEEQTEQARDYDGINRATGTFAGHGWTVVVDAANDTGGGWVASWQVRER